MKINNNTIGIFALIAFVAFAFVAPEFMAIGGSTEVNVHIVGMNDNPLRGVEILTEMGATPMRISGLDGNVNGLQTEKYYLFAPSSSSSYGITSQRFVRGGEYTVKYTDVESTIVYRLGDIPPIDEGVGGDTGDGTGTTNETDHGNLFDRHPALNSGVLWGMGGFIVTWIGIVALIAAGVITAPGTAVLLGLAALGGLLAGLFGAIRNIEVPGNPDAGFMEKLLQLPSAVYDGVKEEGGIIVDKVQETIITTYHTVTDTVSTNLADAIEKLLAGDISGAMAPLFTVSLVFLLIGIVAALVYFAIKSTSDNLNGGA